MSGSGDECTVIVRLARGLRKGSIPVALKFGEAFLLVILGLYIVKVCILVTGMYEDYATDSALAIMSKRPKAWKKVVRASFLLAIFNIVAWLGLSQSTAVGFVAFNPAIVTPLSLIILVMMFTRPIRSYYVPLMEEDMPLVNWVKYAFLTPLYTAEGYRIMYDDSR